MTSWLAVYVRLGIENNMSNNLIREATAADVHALAGLHVRTFNETHAPVLRNGPTCEVREYQWQQLFQSVDGSWFCFVTENPKSDLIGFAKGQPYAHLDQPDFAGELNKIYVLREYHRQGLGRRLVGHVAGRFLSQGISSMLLFGDARSPFNVFYEVLGTERLYTALSGIVLAHATSRTTRRHRLWIFRGITPAAAPA